MTDTTNVEQLATRAPRRRKSSTPPAEASVISPADGANIAMVLGQLTGVVAGVQATVHELKEDARHDRDEASTSRRRLYESIDDLKDRVHAIDLKVNKAIAVDDRLTFVEAEVAKAKRIRQLAGHVFSRGWKLGVGVAGVTSVSAAVWFWKQILLFASRISNLFM